MRCPKCFGELDTGMNCYTCGNTFKSAVALSDGVSKPHLVQETRGCISCKHCEQIAFDYWCEKSQVRVEPSMRVMYEKDKGTCWEAC